LAAGALAAAAGWPDDAERTARVVSGLMADGLVEREADGSLRLPGGAARSLVT
jgi:hypothetical protein